VFYVLFIVWPVAEVFRLSLYSTNFITTKFVGLSNYIDSFNNPMFLGALRNSGLYIGLMVLGMVSASVALAIPISRLSKKWQDTSRIMLYLPVLSGGIIISQVWKWVFAPDGVANWALSLVGLEPVSWFGGMIPAIPIIVGIVIFSSLGSYVIMLLASILAIDRGIFEAAMIDGANDRQIKLKIMVPLLMPTVALIALLSMIASLQIFETIYALCPQEYAYTPTFSIYTMGFKFSKWGMASAQSVILLLIMVILSMMKKRVEQ
jgi:ABC-type sugar transport system permease subunit